MPTCTISYAVQCKAGLAGSLGCKREAEKKKKRKEMILCVDGCVLVVVEVKGCMV